MLILSCFTGSAGADGYAPVVGVSTEAVGGASFFEMAEAMSAPSNKNSSDLTASSSSASKSSKSSADDDSVVEKDEEGFSLELLRQLREHHDVGKEELRDYLSKYEMQHDKPVFQGPVLIESESESELEEEGYRRWLPGFGTLGMGFDVSKSMGTVSPLNTNYECRKKSLKTHRCTCA